MLSRLSSFRLVFARDQVTFLELCNENQPIVVFNGACNYMYEYRLYLKPTIIWSRPPHTHVQDFEVELAGAHIMKVQVCSKSLLKEETYANGKIRVCLSASSIHTASSKPHPHTSSCRLRS